MSTPFGPWATGIDSNSQQRLSTFWTRRMTMLPALSKTPGTPTRRQILQLGTLGLGLAAWPTLRIGRGVESSPAARDQEKARGRLYLCAQFEMDREGVEEVGGLIDVDPESGAWRRIRPLKSGIFSISPDGKQLASGDYESRDGYGRLTNVWIVELERTDAPPRMICEFGDWAVWSGDGSELIVPLLLSNLGEEPRRWEHWRMNADGTNRAKLHLPESHAIMDWSPDDRWLATASPDHPDARGNHVYIIRPDGSDQRRMSSEDISAYARFSPDSRRLAFIQRGVLATVDLDGAARREVYRAGERGLTLSSTAWSPDGRRLACIAADWDRDPEARRGQPEDYRILLVNVEDGSAQTHRIPDVRFLGFINWI
jgi:hypothetical protein